MKTIKILLIAIVVLLSSDLVAQKRLTKIIESGTLRVGLTGNQPPFSMKDKNDQLIGFDVDLANLIATSMELELKFVEMSFAELLPNLKEGKIDLVISGMTITPRRNVEVAFVGPYMISGKSILTNEKTLANATNPQDIDADLRVVTLDGSTSEKFVENYMQHVKVELVQNYENAIQKIIKDESDVMVADYPTCAYAMLRYPDKGMVMLDRPLTIEPIGIALPYDDALFVNMMDNFIESLEATGVLVLMEEKWFENPYWLLELK
ncbi:MAG: transporter substrate-binding domain-containing protein [Reichenbachiella sp.]|uniref:substrate-binding periplasmic protein n=1 Tax=Reichenbachiella sp. TaxID=2184521 RepID=UPI0029668036|nr:transporter substrate-binding domain-containing protein [Reichenbachiella sp.]MDW3211870.1 transporter substrate-binding domain-containing protein [Reichenbachiella sp.]